MARVSEIPTVFLFAGIFSVTQALSYNSLLSGQSWQYTVQKVLTSNTMCTPPLGLTLGLVVKKSF